MILEFRLSPGEAIISCASQKSQNTDARVPRKKDTTARWRRTNTASDTRYFPLFLRYHRIYDTGKALPHVLTSNVELHRRKRGKNFDTTTRNWRHEYWYSRCARACGWLPLDEQPPVTWSHPEIAHLVFKWFLRQLRVSILAGLLKYFWRVLNGSIKIKRKRKGLAGMLGL